MTAPRCLVPPVGAAAGAARQFRAELPCLATARLDLRPATLDDFPLWSEIFAAPDAGAIGGPLNAEGAWDEFCVYVAGWLLHGHGLWAAVRRTDERLLGFALLGLEWSDREPEIGWIFAEEAHGLGYATEAAMAVRDHAAALLGPGSAVSYIDPANAASIELAIRVGATRDPAAEAALGDGTQVWRHGAARAEATA
ncbi:MAG: GNAT family N-acetyltransferase [Rhodobacteraceae bacterium]|nr:GNAT family N-acetyltransferase [Paracoccaceae bacterium]